MPCQALEPHCPPRGMLVSLSQRRKPRLRLVWPNSYCSYSIRAAIPTQVCDCSIQDLTYSTFFFFLIYQQKGVTLHFFPFVHTVYIFLAQGGTAMSNYKKTPVGNLIGVKINVQINCGENCIFAMFWNTRCFCIYSSS